MKTTPQSLKPTLGKFALLTFTSALAVACGNQDSGTVELTVSDNSPADSPPADALDYWAEEVMAQSNGKLKLSVSHGGELLSGDTVYKGLQTGAADIGVYVVLPEDGFLLNTVISLPFMGWPNQEQTMQVYKDLMADYEELRSEWQGVEFIGAYMMPAGHLHSVSRDIRVPSDLNGVKTLVVDELAAEAIVAAGATPVELDIATMSPAIDDGNVEAIVAHFPVLAIFGALDKLQYHMIAGEGGINMQPLTLLMNSDVANNLSPDMRDLLMNSSSIFTDKLLELDEPFIEATIADAESKGQTIDRLSKEEVAQWYDVSKQPVHDRWIAAAEAADLPGQALYDDVLSRLQSLSAE